LVLSWVPISFFGRNFCTCKNPKTNTSYNNISEFWPPLSWNVCFLRCAIISSLRTIRKISASLRSQFFFWGEIFTLAETRKPTLAKITFKSSDLHCHETVVYWMCYNFQFEKHQENKCCSRVPISFSERNFCTCKNPKNNTS